MSRLSDHTRRTLARATELALTSSERIRLSLELIGVQEGAPSGEHLEERLAALRPVAPNARRSAPPPARV